MYEFIFNFRGALSVIRTSIVTSAATSSSAAIFASKFAIGIGSKTFLNIQISLRGKVRDDCTVDGANILLVLSNLKRTSPIQVKCEQLHSRITSILFPISPVRIYILATATALLDIEQ